MLSSTSCVLAAAARRAIASAATAVAAAATSPSAWCVQQRHGRALFSSSSSSGPAAAELDAPTTTSITPANLAGDVPDTMEIPGGRVPVTRELRFVGGAAGDPAPQMPCYRALDAAGRPIAGASLPRPLDEAAAVELYSCMARLQVMDTLFYEAQRQGRFSFYMTCAGEEASVVGSAAGLEPDDVVFAQYREHGVLLWRGFTFEDFANQCYGNEKDPGKGRQMPIHYGSRDLHYHTVSSPLATQLPHAVGAAYALRQRGQARVAIAYFGEGASSEGDFHAALNFGATLGAPVIFFCRNNGYAISTPATEQFRGDGIAPRGPAYGVPSIRVDGGDALAVSNAVAAARALALARSCPVLVEAMSYRSGHHSTSDDSSRYRTREEMAEFRARDPVARFRQYLEHQGWWSPDRDAALRRAARSEAVAALDGAAKVPKAPLSSAYEGVYAEMPWHIKEQRDAALALAKAEPHLVPAGVPVR